MRLDKAYSWESPLASHGMMHMVIANAVAADLAGHTMFDDVSAKALDDRGRKLIRVTVTAPPTYSYDDVAAVLGPEIEPIRAAVDGSDVHVQGLVHFETPTS